MCWRWNAAPQSIADYAMDMDELDYNIRLRMMQNIAEETVTHRHSARDSAVPVRQYGSFHPGTGVGGAGEHWTGMCFRFLPDVFTLRTHLTEKHGAARLPADLAVQGLGRDLRSTGAALLVRRADDGCQRQGRQSARQADRRRKHFRVAAFA
jgi:gluconate 2-dehydrogenase alpha chain